MQASRTKDSKASSKGPIPSLKNEITPGTKEL